MTRTTTYNYEQSSESGRERHIRIPYARLKDVTPQLHDPFCVTSITIGMEMCGTIITLDATASEIIGNVAEGARYLHNVRTVRTYNNDGPPQTEATWAALNIGDPVYYDETIFTTSVGVTHLSTAPLHGDGVTPNPRFGTIVMAQGETAADFPKAAGQAGNTWDVAVLQCGLNES